MDTRIVTGIEPVGRSRAAVTRRFRALLEGGAELRPAGRARRDPGVLQTRPYLPRHEIALFDVDFFLTDLLHDEALGFFVAYVARAQQGVVRHIHPRIFYKDSSLVWRVASHFIHDESDYWIGKGDVRWERREDGDYLCSAEETTDLPYEMQSALDVVSRRMPRLRDDNAVELILRQAPTGRIEPYSDFSLPRKRAAERYRVNGGRPVARFTRKGDPTSLRFTRGYEPDFGGGVLEELISVSRFFGGKLRKFRILSTNRRIQYCFMSSPTHAWINPPQALTTELSTYGVRTVEPEVDEALTVPAYEYHEPDGGHSQIPEGYAGAPHPADPSRSDASAWIEALPVIQDFRKQVLRVATRRSTPPWPRA